jgi:hypothetical protein
MASNSMTDTETTTTESETEKADGVDAGTSPQASADTSAGTSEETSEEKPAAPTTDSSVVDEQTTVAAAPSGSVVTGALALVAAGLGLISLTGNSLGDMMRAREELLGQISAATAGPGDQIAALYTSPWHTVALVNGVLALLAVVVGAITVAVRGRAAGTPSWVKAVALGGTVLGVIGLIVAGGMFLDLFAAAPQLPPMPGLGG